MVVGSSAHAAPRAQEQETAQLRGRVRDAHGPVVGANVFVMGTLDGALTDSAGQFNIRTRRQTQYVLTVQHIGYRELRVPVVDSVQSALTITLEPFTAQALGMVTVEAGRFLASNDPEAVLSPLEIVTIPGTAANVNRAIQTLPGVAQVDEGTGLFVRGGDYTETRVFLNGRLLLNPAQLERPAGSFVGSFDPFLLDKIEFFSGGFMALASIA